MNKSMLMGVVAGIGVATAGGVLGYQFLGEAQAPEAVAVEAEAPADAAPRATAHRHAHGCGRSGRRVLGRGSGRDGRPEGSASDRGHRDRRRGRRRDRQGRRRPRHHDGGRRGSRRADRPQDPGARPGEPRRPAHDDDRRTPLRPARQRASLRALLRRLRAGPATVRPFFFSGRSQFGHLGRKCERFATTVAASVG